MLKIILPALFFLSIVSCKAEPNRLSPSDVESLLKDAPPVIINDGKIRLDGIEEFYIGQSFEDASVFLKKRCVKPLELAPDWKRANTFFLGCLLPDDPKLLSFRIGFHPQLNKQVFTLEVKRPNIMLDAIRAQFYKRLGEPFEDIPKAGVLRMRSKQHNLFASWDSGLDGPMHLIVGVNPETIKDIQ